jgi:hypothetical protein
MLRERACARGFFFFGNAEYSASERKSARARADVFCVFVSEKCARVYVLLFLFVKDS